MRSKPHAFVSALNVSVTLDSGLSENPRLLFKGSNSNTRVLQVKVWRGDTTCTVPQENDTAYVQVDIKSVCLYIDY